MSNAAINPLARPSVAHTPCAVHAAFLRCFSGLVTCIRELLHGVAQLGLTEEEQCFASRDVGAAVVGRFRGHVGKIDTLAKHVTTDRCFWRRDAETLAEDTTKIGRARTMPQKTTIGLDLGIGGLV